MMVLSREQVNKNCRIFIHTAYNIVCNDIMINYIILGIIQGGTWDVVKLWRVIELPRKAQSKGLNEKLIS